MLYRESCLLLKEKAKQSQAYIRSGSRYPRYNEDNKRDQINITHLERHYLRASRDHYQHRLQKALNTSNPRKTLGIYAYATYPGKTTQLNGVPEYLICHLTHDYSNTS